MNNFEKHTNGYEKAKEIYRNQEMPKCLDQVIAKGLAEGQREYKNRHQKRIALSALAASLILFIGGVNYVPAFAEEISKIPLLGQVVKIIKFTNGIGSGGQVTDGSHVSQVKIEEQGTSQILKIRFEQQGTAQERVGHYELRYQSTPETMTVTLSGVRMMAAAEDFKHMEGSQWVKRVYPMMTLDDSMVRFVIEFNEPVNYKAVEYQSPAELQITVNGKEETLKEVHYRMRSHSSEAGESMAILEEVFSNTFKEMRWLKDEQKEGLYYWELGQYQDKETAEKALETAKKISSEPLLIEEIQ